MFIRLYRMRHEDESELLVSAAIYWKDISNTAHAAYGFLSGIIYLLLI